MEEKKYLKWYNKLGYGLGGSGYALSNAIVNTFALVIMTEYVGLNIGIVGTLIMVSKLFDGVSDVLFGTLVDRTHTRLGKARPWMFGSAFGVALTAILTVCIPASMPEIWKYVWFFVFFTSYNAIFYTAQTISYMTLTTLITKNTGERVNMGVMSYFFALGAMMAGTSSALSLAVRIGWNVVTIIFALLGLVMSIVCFFLVKELPEDEENRKTEERKGSEAHIAEDSGKELGLLGTLKLLSKNKYYFKALLVNILNQFCGNMGSVAVYFFIYIIRDEDKYSLINLVGFGSILVGLLFAQAVIKKLGIYRGNLYGCGLSLILKILLIPVGLAGNFPLMLILTFLASLATSPFFASNNALIADIAEYTYETEGIHADGSMFSCLSMGSKVGTALGSGVSGWLLAAAGYISNSTVQPQSALSMISFCYLILPVIIQLVVVACFYFLNVQKDLAQLKAAREAKAG